MSYRFLAAELHELADCVERFFNSEWGIGSGQLRREEPVGFGLPFKPTLHAVKGGNEIICVEVAQSAYTQSLDSFVLACRNQDLPVRLYVAVPSDASGFQRDLREARSNGVGVIEDTGSGLRVVDEALPQSLAGVRDPNVATYRKAIRGDVRRGFETFKRGNPGKGCAEIYDLIEATTRDLAKRAKGQNAWRRAEPKLGNIETTPWSPLTERLLEHLDAQKAGRPRVTSALLGRVLGITGHRNETGHRPRTLARRKKRDRSLRTRFEAACDLLQEFDQAVRRP